MLLLPRYVLKNAIKGLHYCMEFCWEGYKDRGHLQNSGPGLASYFKHVLSPRLFGAKVFALFSHCSLPLYLCVSKYTTQSIRCVCLFRPHLHRSPSVCVSCECLKSRNTAVFILPIVEAIALSLLCMPLSRRQHILRVS